MLNNANSSSNSNLSNSTNNSKSTSNNPDTTSPNANSHASKAGGSSTANTLGSSSSASAAVNKGIQTFQDGRFKNIPSNMLLDQFGMIGILACIKAADKDKDMLTLAHGFDLTALGLNLNSNE